MPFNTFGVATAVTPSVIETYFSHYIKRRPLKQKPTAHISYHEGLRLIRQFLDYSSKHAVEELQAFTAQWVPAPTWVRTQDVEIPPQFLTRSANVLRKQLGSGGTGKVGGEKWWQWRRPESPLHAEWIEMKKDHNERKRSGQKCDRCILYIHGGAYYFGSVDEHRYQMQRHARKLKARVLAPRYRLAPQFPFPCGLYDCIAAYFYLLEHFDPSQILFAGDSAGGGMVVSMLVTLRDQGCPLPAGTILLSPWVDLTHSFPSTSGDGIGDYIPPHGFHHKPSMVWPPPPQAEGKAEKPERKFTQPIEQQFDIVELPATMEPVSISTKLSRDNLRAEAAEAAEHAKKAPPINLNQLPGFGDYLEVEIDNKLVRIQEQIQLYAKNELLTHPLVSPVQQPSLGGLPPILIQVGGGELLRDEQIYLAHKAANPKAYPPSAAVLDEFDPQRTIINQYPPTDVQLQVWEDLCHVPHTLSFTRPAKYMYRSVAQFGAWALARAQHKDIEILDDDNVSIISDGSDHEEVDVERAEKSGVANKGDYGSIGIDGVSSTQFKLVSVGAVGKAGDELPPFREHMIRQRVNRHGLIFPLPHKSNIASLHLDPSTIGTIKPETVRKWLAKRAENETKFSSEYKKLTKKRAKEAKDGYDRMEDGEYPPPSALINRRRRGVAPEEKKRGKSWGLAMWSGWGSSHDEHTIQREEKALDEKAEQDAAAADKEGSIAASSILKSPNGTDISADGKAAPELSAPTVSHGNDQETDDTVKRRRSSASVLSSSAWSKRGDDTRSRSPYRHVKDAGQASDDRSPTISPIQGTSFRQAWSESRRSSVASRSLHPTNREAAAATSPPTLGSSVSQPPMVLNAAPTTAETNKGQEATKVPGTDNTFLNPDDSRPHNGIVAYPFKLRQASGRASPNPSTLTLDSEEDSDKESTHPNSHKEGMLSSLDATRRDGAAAEQIVTGRQEIEAPLQAELADTARQDLPQSHAHPESALPAIPVSSTAEAPPTLQIPNASENDPVSPVSPLEATVDTQTKETSATSFNLRQTRDSRLGVLGADGMPTAAWPDHQSQESGVATDSALKSAPFKIRNPVYDSRLGTDSSPPAAVPEQQDVTAIEAARVAPFKLRHTIYDAKVAPPGSKPPTCDLPPVPLSNPKQEEADAAAAVASAAATAAAVQASRDASMQTYQSTTPSSDQVLAGPKAADVMASAAATAAAVRAGQDTDKEVLQTTKSPAVRAPVGPKASSQAPITSVSTRDAPSRSPVDSATTHDFPVASVSGPAAIAARSAAMRAPMDDGPPRLPPPPPPKDDVSPLMHRNRSNSNFTRKPVPVPPTSKYSTGPTPPTGSAQPFIGNLSFESSPINLTERPPLEKFVTANEGVDLKSVREQH